MMLTTDHFAIDHRPLDVRAMQDSLLSDPDSITGQHARQFRDVFGLEPAKPTFQDRRRKRPKKDD